MNKYLKTSLVLSFVLLFFSIQLWSQAVFEVKPPSKGKGFYTFGIGDSTKGGWGNGVLAKKSVLGNLAIATGADSLAGSPLVGNYQGKILLVHRGGGVDFATKSLNAKNAGAIAVVILNHGIQQNGSVDSLEVTDLIGIRTGENATNATGLQVNIPVLMLGLKDALKLKNAIRSEGNVEAYIGGKQQYNYDLKIDPNVIKPFYRTRPSFLVKTGMVSDTLGMRIYNVGLNQINNILGVVTLNKKGGPILFSDKILVDFMESPGVGKKDTLPIIFPNPFKNNADLEKGTYEINYKLVTLKANSFDTVLLDNYNMDNSVTTYFQITDSTNSVGNLTSYSSTKTNTNEVVNYVNQPNWSTTLRPTGSFKSCSAFQNKDVKGFEISGINFFAFYNDANTSSDYLLNKRVNIEVMEGGFDKVIYSNEYVFDKKYQQHYGNHKVPTGKLVLSNNSTYYVCVSSSDELLRFGYEKTSSYNLSPVVYNGTNYLAGFGTDYVSSISLDLSKTKSEEKEFLSFKLVKPDSSRITINNSTYTIQVPKGTDLTKLVAEFTSSPLSNVFVNGVKQVSGVTANNFLNKTVEYVVVAENGTQQSYFVTVDFCSTYSNIIGQYGNNNASCPNQKVYFYISNDTQVEKQWNFGNGKTLVKSDNYGNVSMEYDKKGEYLVFVTYKNKECFNSIDTSYTLVTISDTLHPNANFNLDKLVLCPNEPFNLSVPNYNEKSYSWSMGDGTVYSETYINHAYKEEGDNIIKLTVTNACGNTSTTSKIIKVSKKASNYYKGYAYIYTSSTACVGEPISFSASGNPQSIVWNFKDNSATSTDMQTNHSFKTAGEYLVQAKMTNFCGVDTIVSQLVTVKSSMPFTNVETLSDVTLCPGELHRLFYNNYSNKYKSVEWVLPSNEVVKNDEDRSFSVGDNVVKLKLTNFCGNDTLLTKMIKVNNNIPVPNNVSIYNYSKAEYCPGEEFGHSVNVSSYDQFKSIDWSGEGLIRSDKGWGTYNINKPGEYTINVKLTNYCGKDTTLFKQVKIVDKKNFDGVQFTDYYFNKTYCPGQQVNLYYSNSNIIKNAEFDYGDKTFGKDDSHVYKEMGDYIVKAKLTNFCNSDTTIQGVIKINKVLLSKTARISVYGSSTSEIKDYCKGDNIDLSINDYSSDNYKSITWNFGDGTSIVSQSNYTSHIFTKSGLLTVKATVMNFCGDTLTISKQINIRTDVAFKGYVDINYTNAVCPNELINFSSSNEFKSVSWDFGDKMQAQGNEVSHAYTGIGEYQLKVSLKNNCNIDTVVTRSVKVATDIKPDFELDGLNTLICPGEKASFVKWAPSKDYQYTYDFGDQSTLYEENNIITNASIIYHKYVAVGDYKVIVTTKNKCGLTAKDSVQIKVANGLKIDKSNVEIGEDKLPNDTSLFYISANGLQYVWNFGGNNIVKTDVPVVKHSLKPNTTERISVFVTTACGDTATFVKYYPKVYTPGSSSTSYTACGTYLWNGTKYMQSGVYTFTTKTNKGVDSVATLYLTVKPLPNKDLAIVNGIISANQVDAVYQWLNCDAGYANVLNEKSQTFKPSSKGNYAVIVDLNGCVDTTSCVKYELSGIDVINNVKLEIYPNPTSGEITLVNAPIGNYTIVNEIGAVVYQFEVKELVNQMIQLNQFAKGVYFLRSNQRANVQEKIVLVD